MLGGGTECLSNFLVVQTIYVLQGELNTLNIFPQILGGVTCDCFRHLSISTPRIHIEQNSLPCLFLFFPLSCDPKLCPNNFLSLPLNLLILMSLICSAEHYTTFCPIILTTYLTLSDKGNGGYDIPADGPAGIIQAGAELSC